MGSVTKFSSTIWAREPLGAMLERVLQWDKGIDEEIWRCMLSSEWYCNTPPDPLTLDDPGSAEIQRRRIRQIGATSTNEDTIDCSGAGIVPGCILEFARDRTLIIGEASYGDRSSAHEYHWSATTTKIVQNFVEHRPRGDELHLNECNECAGLPWCCCLKCPWMPCGCGLNHLLHNGQNTPKRVMVTYRYTPTYPPELQSSTSPTMPWECCPLHVVPPDSDAWNCPQGCPFCCPYSPFTCVHCSGPIGYGRSLDDLRNEIPDGVSQRYRCTRLLPPGCCTGPYSGLSIWSLLFRVLADSMDETNLPWTVSVFR